jgi:hypothetical protein
MLWGHLMSLQVVLFFFLKKKKKKNKKNKINILTINATKQEK